MGARPADTFEDVAFEIEHKQKVTRRIEQKQVATVPVNGNRRWVVKQTLVSAFANVAEKLPVGSVHRNPIWQQQAAPRSPFDAERVAAPEDVNGTDVRVNNEDASAGVNRNVMGRQKNSFASVGKGDNVIPKQRQQRLPSYRFHSMGRRFIVL